MWILVPLFRVCLHFHFTTFRRGVGIGIVDSLHVGSDLRVPTCHKRLKHVQTGLIIVAMCLLSFQQGFAWALFEPCSNPQL